MSSVADQRHRIMLLPLANIMWPRCFIGRLLSGTWFVYTDHSGEVAGWKLLQTLVSVPPGDALRGVW
jgi:hypothetical protein